MEVGYCNPDIPHINCATVLTTKHALFIPPLSPCNSIGPGPTMSTGQFGDVCLGRPFRLISCKGGWLLDPVSLICIHSHGGFNGKSSQQCTVRSMVLPFAASPLKMGRSTLPTKPCMVMRLRDVLLRQSSKLSVASSSYMERTKDIASSVT